MTFAWSYSVALRMLIPPTERPSCANFDQGSLFSAAMYKGLLAC